jgi:hypothetical protein
MDVEENAPKRGRREVPLSKASARTQGRRFEDLDNRISDSMPFYTFSIIHSIVDDTELLEAWHERSLGENAKVLIGMAQNLIAAEKRLPETSPSRTVFIRTATEGM